ncbi:MAG: four helix bundle protein [Verrucomicrobia bacterium]|nr:MAG: four helix bundle protein [Verrucomicrobiota bacterium]
MSKAELLARTKSFSLGILKLVDHILRTMSGQAIGSQLVRCGTAIGANNRAACRSRSHTEFTAKLGVVAEEADETVYWLELLRDGNLVSEPELSRLLREANELTAIFTAGRRSSSRTQTSNLKHSTFHISS